MYGLLPLTFGHHHKAVKYSKRSVVKKLPFEQVCDGIRLFTVESEDKAFRNVKRAAHQGNALGLVIMGLCSRYGAGLEMDSEMADWL
jgi:hypothetical protein